MRINRKELVERFSPMLREVDTTSPLTVGNGEFAFTADVTGLQSLYDSYRKDCPLCTMSQWGWHTIPVSGERYAYTLDDFTMSAYTCNGRTVRYPRKGGPKPVYEWLRQNPHKFNLARIGFVGKDGVLCAEELSDICQRLDMYEGILDSRFTYHGQVCHVRTCCDSKSDTLAVTVESSLLAGQELKVRIAFPYGSPLITGSDFKSTKKHQTEAVEASRQSLLLKRTLDRDQYYVRINCGPDCTLHTEMAASHVIDLSSHTESLSFCVSFGKEHISQVCACQEVFDNSRAYWLKFWEEGGFVKFESASDPRAQELQRRVLLSLYLMAVNSSGSMPPQETGLTCNSWYGKAHLEMHFWHSAWAPLWNHGDLLERSLNWYSEHLPEARENAAHNDYKGCRWPKMVAYDAVDSPSGIATVLIWQQPHILFMLELLYRSNQSRDFMEKYWEIVKETADFMADFAVFNRETGVYELLPPLIPVQERHAAEVSRNPAFEVEYWRYGLLIALEWAQRLDQKAPSEWEEVASHMAPCTVVDGLYMAHADCPDTFEEFNRDHPSMLMTYGVLASDRIDREVMRNTLHKVIDDWSYETLWGWDFAVMAMTAGRLGEKDTAVDCLLKDTIKNVYVTSGNNRQVSRNDLPLYLPGTGSLLLAVAFLAVGSDTAPACFPDTWEVECENMSVYI
ncbi:MAG: glycoside hydrolase family 65 [Lachnospiraceae bacterium]|nr:glycoside hydrolase family 65 [Lachnospiraceae bacterium]